MSRKVIFKDVELKYIKTNINPMLVNPKHEVTLIFHAKGVDFENALTELESNNYDIIVVSKQRGDEP